GMRSNVLILFAGAAALASSPAIAQIRPIAAVPAVPAAPAPAKPKTPAAKKPAPEALVPGNPDYAPDQPESPAAAPAPAPLPPAVWDVANAQDLLHYIQQIGAEGLNPEDYNPAAVE